MAISAYVHAALLDIADMKAGFLREKVMTSILGEKIRRLRTEKGYSFGQFAKLTGTSNSYLWGLENQKSKRPSADKINRIAAALEVTPEYLLEDRDIAPDEKVLDDAFFKKFKRLDPETKKKLKKIMECF